MRFIVAFFVLVAATSPAHAACEPGEMTIRFGLAKAGEFVARKRAAVQLRDAVDKELQGKACLEIVEDDSLYTGPLAVTALQSGTLEMAAPTLATLGGFSTAYRVFDLPFAFRDIYALERFVALAGPELGKALTANGLVAFGVWQEHFKQIAAKQPVFVPKDIAGLKFRATDSVNASAMFSTLKATAQMIAENDLTVALRTGRVEAQISNWEKMEADKTATLLAGVTQTNHVFTGHQLVVSKLWWDQLDPALAKSLEELIARITRQANFGTQQREISAKRTLMRGGIAMRALTRQQRQEWRNALSAIWTGFAGDENQKWIDALKTADAGL